MILDANLGLSANQAITVTAPSQSIIDLAGVGAGNPVPNIIGTATTFGEDIGIGDGMSPPVITAIVGTAFTAGGAATLQVQLQAAVDNGSNQPGTWDTIAEQDAYPLSVLTAGQKLCEFTVPPRYPGQGFPRFYRLNYVVATGPMTAGTIAYAGINTGRDDVPLYPVNY